VNVKYSDSGDYPKILIKNISHKFKTQKKCRTASANTAPVLFLEVLNQISTKFEISGTYKELNFIQ
jgi:hypothetical protein